MYRAKSWNIDVYIVASLLVTWLQNFPVKTEVFRMKENLIFFTFPFHVSEILCIFISEIQMIMGKGSILTISLKPHLADYCRHEMRQDKEGNLILSRKNDIGRHIYSNIVTSDTPVKGLPISDPINFLIPVTGANQYIMKYRFVYVSRWGEEKIQDYIESEFNLRMRLLFEAGYKKNYSQKQIVESILQAYNIKNTALNYEAVKKSDYRMSRKNRKIIFDDLQKSVI